MECVSPVSRRSQGGLQAPGVRVWCARLPIVLDCGAWAARLLTGVVRRVDPMHGLDDLLSPQDLSVYLGVPVATLYMWRYHGEGPPGFRVGKHVRYRSIDVEAWIASQVASDRTARPTNGGEGWD